MSETNGNGKKIGAPIGNKNALGFKHKPSDEEREARRRARELLALETENSVRVLVEIRDNPDSTNFDKRACAEALLDRTIPKMTQERVLLEDSRRTTFDVPGLTWPAPLKVIEGAA